MAADRITEIRIEGLRVFDKLRLDVRGLSVLIGDNGTGKSTVLEAFELLRKAGSPEHFNFVDDVVATQHGPFRDLLRAGSEKLTLGVVIRGDEPSIEYSFTLGLAGTAAIILDERVEALHLGVRSVVLSRTGDTAFVLDSRTGQTVESRVPSAVALFAQVAARGLNVDAVLLRLSEALRSIEYHPAFDTRPLWQQRELQVRVGPRWPAAPEPGDRLRRYGHNLPAALLVLRNHGGEMWERFLVRARAAVDVELTDVALDAAGGGQIEAFLKFRGGRPPLPVRALSEGQIAYVAMVAAVELAGSRGALLLDEPDIHYHPELSVNLMLMLEELSGQCPVVVATHSDRMLDALQDPAASVLLCERRPYPLTLQSEHHRKPIQNP